jgi:hypothetical protein
MDLDVWNSNGTGGNLHVDKQNDVIKLIQENHVTVLLETRTNMLDSLMTLLRDVGGRAWQFLCTQVLKDSVTLWKLTHEAQNVRLRCYKAVRGTSKDMMFGAGYVPPEHSKAPNNR